MAVFDLDAAIAEGSKGKDPFAFTFGGEDYVLPPDPDMVAIAQIIDGDLRGGFSRLLGTEQWIRVETSPVPLTVTGVQALLEAYADHAGIDLGEVSASSMPSNRMARRSKPTSNGSTGSASPTSEQVR